MDKKRVFLIMFVVLISFLMIFFSYKVFFTFADYNIEQQMVIDYLNDRGELSEGMTSAEASHLGDVKEVMKIVDYVFYFLLLVCSLIFTYNGKDKAEMKKLLLYGGLAALVLVGIFFVLVNFSFGWFFTFFHRVFFPSGNWLFPVESYLIQNFPTSFFISMVWKIALLSLFLASIFIGGGIYLKYVKKY